MKEFLLIFFWSLNTNLIMSQCLKTDSEVFLRSKIFFVNEMHNKFTKPEQVSNFLSKKNIEFLNSEGLDNCIKIVKITSSGNFHKVIGIEPPDTLFFENRVPLSCHYIMAFNTKSGTIYRLKGFKKNDFRIFLKREIRRKKKNVKIDQIDQKCLWKYNKRKKEKLKCFSSCEDRDLKFFKLSAN